MTTKASKPAKGPLRHWVGADYDTTNRCFDSTTGRFLGHVDSTRGFRDPILYEAYDARNVPHVYLGGYDTLAHAKKAVELAVGELDW